MYECQSERRERYSFDFLETKIRTEAPIVSTFLGMNERTFRNSPLRNVLKIFRLYSYLLLLFFPFLRSCISRFSCSFVLDKIGSERK